MDPQDGKSSRLREALAKNSQGKHLLRVYQDALIVQRQQRLRRERRPATFQAF